MIYLLISCTRQIDTKNPLPLIEDADVYADQLGEAVSWISEDIRVNYNHGRDVMKHDFSTKEGLGPTFNADSCAGCHQMPVAGGSAPKYRDLWLIKKMRWDGAMIDVGTNGESPVRNLYTIPPTFHTPEDPDTVLYARRNAPPGFGVGLFAFIEDETIIANADINDDDNDGISGKPNFEQGRVGRFGYKSQAFTLESFNRGAIFNQMGITSNPIYYSFLENPTGGLASLLLPSSREQNQHFYEKLLSPFGILSSAFAQVSAPDEPTVDDDDAPDPEISNEDQRDLLIFSTYLAAPRPKNREDFSQIEWDGALQFSKMGCSDCHIPRLDSTIGPIRAYTDLLLHDMGTEMNDGITPGFAEGSEFRTQPLWGVALHTPYLHDGRAETLEEAIEWHGGEGEKSRNKWLQATLTEQESLLAFLHTLGGEDPNGGNFILPSTPSPTVGTLGGPRRELTDAEYTTFVYGWKLFDRNIPTSEGRNTYFNADSCRACHQDPVIGGAGGIDVNVLRIGKRDEISGLYEDVSTKMLHRSADIGEFPEYLDMEANIIEARQPISLLGIGYIQDITNEAILANQDEEDENGDGISGRAHILSDGRVGKFGWKAQIPTIQDFVADALLNEIGLTIHPSLSDFTIEDDNDTCEDPELFEDDFEAIAFFLKEISPPLPLDSSSIAIQEGQQYFEEIGCSLCHIPTLDNVPLYSDLLLHDISKDGFVLVEHDENVLATEFRTPPLWGMSETAPYMHDGAAPTIEDAILLHGGEAQHIVDTYQLLSTEEQQILIRFLETL